MMNNVLFADTVTLWNHYIDPATRCDAWQRTVLRGVQYRRKTEKQVTGEGIIVVADSVSVTIPNGVSAEGRAYLPPLAFKRLAMEQRPNHWTLNAAGNKDVLALGEVPVDVGGAYTLANLKAEYGYATVKSASDNRLRPRLKHWKVTAT